MTQAHPSRQCVILPQRSSPTCISAISTVSPRPFAQWCRYAVIFAFWLPVTWASDVTGARQCGRDPVYTGREGEYRPHGLAVDDERYAPPNPKIATMPLATILHSIQAETFGTRRPSLPGSGEPNRLAPCYRHQRTVKRRALAGRYDECFACRRGSIQVAV